MSVVVPTLDEAELTGRAVRSAMEQGPQVREVIVVDDGSEIPLSAAMLKINDARLRVLRLATNLGAAAARQAGIEAAGGELIAFLDADDVWLPGKLAAQLPLLQAELDAGRLAAVACGWSIQTDRPGGQRIRVPIPSCDPIDFASGCWFSPGSTLLVAREVFATVGPFDTSLRRLEDLDWCLRFALAGGRLVVAPIVGAVIVPSGRARYAVVDDAARRIEARYRSGPRIDARMLRRLRAYLQLERAAALNANRRYIRMTLHLLRSFIASPRTRLPLRPWWTTTSRAPTSPARVDCL